MYKSTRFLLSLAMLVAIGSASAFAATAKTEGTPAPTPPKPDFSSMLFLIGTWNCVDISSRRPTPFNTTEVWSMDPTGYWIVRDQTIHKASWIPREVKTQTKYTWDVYGKHWIRIETGDFGGYTVATAPAHNGYMKTYTWVIQTKAPDIASYGPYVITKTSDTKKVVNTSFTETSGRVVHATETCTKT